MIASPWLGGEPVDAAVSVGGRTLSYGELRSVIEAYALPAEPLVLATQADPLEQLLCVLAALHQGRPVLVGPAEAAELLPLALPPASDLVLLTSGSSGRARGVARTARSWYESFSAFTDATGIRPSDVVALSGPLHVSMHLFAALHTLWLGAELSDDVARAGVTQCTPTVLRRLLSSTRMPQRVIVAGAALPQTTREAALARGVTLIEYYGAAELSLVAITDADGTLRAFDGVELCEREGVLWVHSPYVALGYAANAAHAQMAGALQRDDAGFATVGDLVELSDDGALHVRGRGDSAVTTAGTTVLSEDVERALEGLAGVHAAAVIAEPHPVLGEILVAVIERGVASNNALNTAYTAARTALAPAERPRRWLIVERLPRTASGKLAKGALRTGLADGSIAFSELEAHTHVS